MKNLILIMLLLLLSAGPMQAHEGHGDAKPKTTTEGGFKAEAVSDKYEYVVKYAHADAGEEATFTLYINEFNTNRPVKAGTVKLDLGGSTVTAKSTQPGIYVFNAPATSGAKNLKVSLESKQGADLVLLKGLDPTQEPPKDAEPAAPSGALPAWSWALIGGLIGATLVFIFMRLSGRKAKAALGLALFLVPLSQPLGLSAHEGHGDAAQKSGAGLANGRFLIAKESQFLFGLLTARVQQGQYAPSIQAFGTVIPSPQGQAEVVSPQSGRLASLSVKVGDRVKKGQALASVEQVIDAQTAAQLESERNNLRAELTAARAEYERLQTIADIAAKRDLTEVQARYNKAVQNVRVFERTVSGQGRRTTLTSPIDGVMQGFNLAIGTNVTAGELLFTVTNLTEVFVEAQVFDRDLPAFSQAGRFTVTQKEANGNGASSEAKLVNIGQTLNPTNQTQRVTFQLVNAGRDFKIGEFVDVRAFSAPRSGVVTVPTSAITEVDGKPVVFIKDAPEEFFASFIELGESNGEVSVVLKGVEAGERVAASAAYQAKMIYENQ